MGREIDISLVVSRFLTILLLIIVLYFVMCLNMK